MSILAVLSGAGSALADPAVTVTPPAALSSQPGAPVLFTGASVSGFLGSVRIVLGVDSGTLELTSGSSGVTVPNGYPAVGATGSGVAFEGTQAQVNAALGAVEWTPTVAGAAQLTISATLAGAIYNPANGHYYQSVNHGSSISWSSALAAAAARTPFNGYTGYLATITSQTENTLLSLTTGAASWIGATEDAAYGAPGSGAHTGNYTWAAGPEIGTVFWNSACGTGKQGICAGTGGFNYFNAGEPNNSGGAEHYLQFNAPLNSGRWNDLPNSASVNQYLVEFGHPSETPTYEGAATQTFTGTAVPGAPTAVSGSAGDGRVSVSFTAPAANGSAITAYTVTASPGGAGCSPVLPATVCEVSGLTNGSAYTFTVTATNAVGVGSASSPSSPVTPARFAIPIASPEPDADGSETLPNAPVVVVTPTSPTGFADLELLASAPTIRRARKNLVYVFRIVNVGPTTATGVVLRTKLTKGAAPLISTSSSCAHLSQLVCPLASIAAGGSVKFTIVVRPGRAGRYSNKAEVSAHEPDSEPANNRRVIPTLVTR